MAEYRFRDKNLNIDERTEALLKELTLDEKLGMLGTWQRPIERLGLKGFSMANEAARGLVLRDEVSTVFPEPFGLAATFDPEIMHRMGEITGIETRIYHNKGKASLCEWGPTVDAARDPRWGRNEEAYGEDPYLVGELSAAYTNGMIGDDPQHYRVLPMLKHFYANNNEEDRSRDNACIPTALKHDYYLKFFETAFLKGGAKGVMTSYNEINGVEALCNPELTDILKKQWGMLFAVTDGGDFPQNVHAHRTDENYVETAARIYSVGGADVSTGGPVAEAVKKAIELGRLTEENIDCAIRGILKARFLLDDIDGDSPYNSYDEKLIACEEFYKATEKAAIESVILLRNDRKALPLDKAKKTAVIGTHANMNFVDWYTGLSDRDETIMDVMNAQIGKDRVVYDSGNDIVALKDQKTGLYFSVNDNGGVSASKQERDESCLFELFDWGDNAISLRSVKNGLFATGNGNITCSAQRVYGWYVGEMFYIEYNEDGIVMHNCHDKLLSLNSSGRLACTHELRPDNFKFDLECVSCGKERAVELAKSCQQVVLFAGNHPLINAREGYDRKHIDLPQAAQGLLDAVLEINRDAVLFMVSGYPYALKDNASHAMHITHAGPALGIAVTKTLFGEVSPSGKCPMTWYRSTSELRDIKNYNIIQTKSTYLYYDGKPLFPFGHGISYTDFEYSGRLPDGESHKKSDRVELSFEIKNVGGMDADEIAQLYIIPPRFNASIPLKQLKGFKRVSIKAGQTEKVTVTLDLSEISYWDISRERFCTYSGSYKLLIGSSSEDIRLCGEIIIDGDEYIGIDVSKTVPGACGYDYTFVDFGTDKLLHEYANIQDWRSFISYHDCDMRGYNKVELIVGSRDGGSIKISCDGEQIAEVQIPRSDGSLKFSRVVANAIPVEGRKTLRFEGGGALSSFRFYKE